MPPTVDDLRRVTAKSLGKQFVESNAFERFLIDRSPSMELDASLKDLGVGRKATLTTFGPDFSPLSDVVATSAQEEPTLVVDLVPTIPSAAMFIWGQETTYTNTAAETPETNVLPEVAFSVTRREDRLRKVGAWLPVFEDLFEDSAAAEAYIDARMPFAVRQRLDRQLLVGDGLGENLRGFHNTSGLGVVTYSTLSTNLVQALLDSVVTAAKVCRTDGKAQPHAVVFNPEDFEDILLAKDGNRQYLRARQLLEDAGLTPVQSAWQPAGQALVGDFARQSLIADRRGIAVDKSPTHANFFAENKIAVRATVRAWLAVLRPTAFCRVVPV